MWWNRSISKTYFTQRGVSNLINIIQFSLLAPGKLLPSLDVCCLNVLHFTFLKYDNLGINNYWDVGHFWKLAFQCVSHPRWVNGLWFVGKSSVFFKSLGQFEPNSFGIVGGPLVNASNCCLLSKTTNGTLDWVVFSSPNITPLHQTDFHSRINPKIVS